MLQLAELIADAVNHGCEVVEAMPASAYVTQGWADYGNYLLENSPAMDHVVNQHPLWWGPPFQYSLGSKVKTVRASCVRVSGLAPVVVV